MQTEDDTAGPSIRNYLETRLNLMTVASDKLEKAIDAKFAAQHTAVVLASKSVDERFKHIEQIVMLGQETAKRAVDKAEAAQGAHNVAANEWRGTLNDFKTTLVSKSEFDKLYTDFQSYRLEVARLFSQQIGEKSGSRENSGDSRAMWAMVIAVAAVLMQVIVFAVKH